MRRFPGREFAIAVLGALAFMVPVSSVRADPEVRPLLVRPSEVDPRIKDFDQPNVVVTPPNISAKAPLVVFLPGTRNRPTDNPVILKFIASQGYKVIGLEYDDDPSVSEVCPRDPDPDCSGDFRYMRAYGAGSSRRVSNPPAESIDTRLAMLLAWLDAKYPAQGWDAFVKNGHPQWSLIVVSGASQGAGMAAFIAKHSLVKRVVLFSSPWDWTIAGRRPAPWLSAASATPPDRWYAEYHRRELTAGALQAAYAALVIPRTHIFVFDKDFPAWAADAGAHVENPYHGLTVVDDRYAGEWRQMFGQAQ
jgi:hypothetical protein